MANNFGALVFTPLVKALQKRYGSRRQYARLEGSASAADRLGPEEKAFIAEQEGFHIATVGESGWPYVQHRGGSKGFVKVIDDQTIGFVDFRGNRQYVTTGNLGSDDRVALIMVDYPGQSRLKILGHAEVFEGSSGREWAESVRDSHDKSVVERAFVIRVKAFDWNCPQHITQRFTAEQIHEALAPLERRLQELEQENETLRRVAQRARATPSPERTPDCDVDRH